LCISKTRGGQQCSGSAALFLPGWGSEGRKIKKYWEEKLIKRVCDVIN